MSNIQNKTLSSIPKMPAGLPTKMPAGLPTKISPTDVTKLAKLNPASLSASLASSALSQAGMQSPIAVMIDYLLYTMYSLVGSIIYYPAFLANLPESNLEESLPKHDLCMKMGLSERTCKKKLKCFLKSCHYLDDPDGYKLDKRVKKPCNKKGRQQQRPQITKKSIMMGGAGRKKRTRKYYQKNGWRKYLSHKMIMNLRKKYEKNILKGLFDTSKNNKTRKRRKYIGGNDIFDKGCINKINYVRCSQIEHIEYPPDNHVHKLPKTLKIKHGVLRQMGGSNEDKIKEHIIGLIKEHNEELHKKIDENPEQVSNIINEIKKKYPAATKAALMFPNTIKKFSKLLIPYIQKFDVSNISDEAIKSMNISSMISSGSASGENETMDIESNSQEEKTTISKKEKNLIRSFFVEQIKSDCLFKLAIIIKVMEQLFEDDPISEEEKQGIREQVRKDDVSVVFPWNFNNPTLQLKDKIKCLSSHITQTKFEREQNPDLYDKCFVCKHCTLRNTASKVWVVLSKDC